MPTPWLSGYLAAPQVTHHQSPRRPLPTRPSHTTERTAQQSADEKRVPPSDGPAGMGTAQSVASGCTPPTCTAAQEGGGKARGHSQNWTDN